MKAIDYLNLAGVNSPLLAAKKVDFGIAAAKAIGGRSLLPGVKLPGVKLFDVNLS